MRPILGKSPMLGNAIAATLLISVIAATPVLAAGEVGETRAKEASAAMQRGLAEKATLLYTEALADAGLPNVRRAAIHNDRGVAFARLNQPRVAIDDFNRAVQLSPETASVYNNRGNVLLSIGFAYWLLAYMRRRQSRWFPLAGSVVAFATIFAFVLAGDYVTDYFDPFDWGVAVVALFGIVATLLAYAGLQRYLLRRVPPRRVRRHQCPFCGYPLGAGAHCEGCGREVVAPCASCEAPRRVGTAHCTVCGATS